MDEDLEMLIPEETIRELVAGLAQRISRDYAGKDVLLISVLKGAAIFTTDLMRAMTIPSTIEFVQVSSYGNDTVSSGTATMTRDINQDIRGRHILLVDCIIDTGETLRFLFNTLNKRNPSSIEAVVLLDKKARRKTAVQVKYIGIDAPDAFLVGYGLDSADQYRNLPYIAALKPDAR